MTRNNNIFMGIDVSKETLDISVSGKHYKIKNQQRLIAKFINSEIIQKLRTRYIHLLKLLIILPKLINWILSC